MDIQCLCCLGYNDVHSDTEVYITMLRNCFQIEIIVSADNKEWGVCEVCAALIRSANDFRNQVLACQKLYEKGAAKGKAEVKIDTLVKTEKLKKTKVIKDGYKSRKKHKEKITEVLQSPIKQEPLDDDFDFSDSIKYEYLDLSDSDEDDKNLALLAIEQLTKKSVRTSDGDGSSRKRKQDGIKAISKKKTKVSLKPATQPSQGAKPHRTITLKPIRKYLTELQKHRHNVKTLLKHSNALPFTNKTLHGYVCAFCPETFLEPLLLRDHTHNVHQNDEISIRQDNKNICIKLDITDLKCLVCDSYFNVISDLKHHLISEHAIKFYTDVNDYVLEFKLSNDEVLNCALCQSSYETFKMLLQHMNGHYRNYICSFCAQGFINQSRLKNHLRTHETGDFKCSYCDKVFSTQSKRTCHEKYTHKNGARYTTNCPHCELSFTNYYTRNRHMAAVHNQVAASYKCNICDRNFLMKSKLTYHIKQIHLMERNHICSQCGQGFFMKQYLEEHMIKHNGERIFKCTICPKAYARKKTLREHMRIHNNDRRFRCEVCDLAFVQKCSLKSHMLSNHGLTLKNLERSSSLTIRAESVDD